MSLLDDILLFVQMVFLLFYWLVAFLFYLAIGLLINFNLILIRLFYLSRLRQCSRNILHVNIFLVFLIRSAIQLFAELRMSRGYFAHNVFDRTDACNRTTIYFKEDQVR
jgi:hypothetical protein